MIISMKKQIWNCLNRTISIILLLSLLLSFTSCSNDVLNRNADRSVIAKDSPWYEGEIIDVKLALDPQRNIDNIFQSLAGVDNKYIVVYSDGAYKVNDWGQINKNSDYAIKQITIIDRLDKRNAKTVDLYSIIDSNDWPEAATYFDGILLLKCEAWDSSKNQSINRDYHIDLTTETIVETQDYEKNYEQQYWKSFYVGNYRIETFLYFGEGKAYCPLKVYSPDGSVINVDIKDSEKDLFEVPVILGLDDTTALIPVFSNTECLFFKLDLNTNNLLKVNEKEYEWLNLNQIQHSYNGRDGKVYFTTPKGVSKIDIENKTVEQVLDFNCCDVNRQYLSQLDIAECSDGEFLLCGQYNSSNMFTSKFVNNFAIVEFKIADKNPHIGKRILELYIPDGEVDAIISDAIIRFNNTNRECFIEISDRYNRQYYLDYSGICSLDDYDSAQMAANVQLSNDLAMALMNGEGPDILLNTSDLGQLNNDNYLVDLSAYTADLDSNKYFTNIINGTESDGKLYQLPVSFTIEGIQTDPKYAGKTGIGFTTEEYREFLYETLNGKDVIESGQVLYFVKLFNGMSDGFIVNGKVDLTSSDFADITEYVRDNVQQDSLSWDAITNENIEDFNFTTQGNRTAYYCNCPGISGYLVKRAQIKNGTAILGIPSSDGRGPMLGTDISVAVSKNAVNIDACVEFVKILLSDDVQNELVMSDKFVLNRDAFKKGCNAAIEYFNTEEGSQNLFDYAAGTYVTSHMKFTSEDIDNLENVILSCSKMDSADSAINAILIEEMPAYFLGQKDLDSVVVIIQDRVQKVLDERS